MTLTDDALTTLATVKQELNISTSTDDTYLTFLIEIASARIKSFCNRTFYYTAAITEYLPGSGNNFLVVSRPPIVALTSIAYNDCAVASTDYEIHNANAGLIYNPGGWYWTAQTVNNIAQDTYPGSEQKLYTVIYGGGFVTPSQTGTRNLPYDLEQACIELVVTKYRNRGRDYRIESEHLLSWGASYSKNGDLPDGVREVLKDYTIPVVM